MQTVVKTLKIRVKAIHAKIANRRKDAIHKFTHGVEAFSGVIDSDFRGSVRVLMESAGDHYEIPSLRINPGDRVAQASLVSAPRVTFTVVEQLSLTERGAGGSGSTGL